MPGFRELKRLNDLFANDCIQPFVAHVGVNVVEESAGQNAGLAVRKSSSRLCALTNPT